MWLTNENKLCLSHCTRLAKAFSWLSLDQIYKKLLQIVVVWIFFLCLAFASMILNLMALNNLSCFLTYLKHNHPLKSGSGARLGVCRRTNCLCQASQALHQWQTWSLIPHWRSLFKTNKIWCQIKCLFKYLWNRQLHVLPWNSNM